MLCEICGKNEATFHYSEVVDGNKTEHHLCGACAAKTDISYYSSLFDNDRRFGQFLSGLLGNTSVFGQGEEDPKTHITCPNCGLSYGDFIRNSAFGCDECYNVFGPLLDDSIKKIQGSTVHTGKKPKHYCGMDESEPKKETEQIEKTPLETGSDEKKMRQEAEVLDRRLKVAVAEEDFEEAARLRDRIKEIKSEIERTSKNA